MALLLIWSVKCNVPLRLLFDQLQLSTILLCVNLITKIFSPLLCNPTATTAVQFTLNNTLLPCSCTLNWNYNIPTTVKNEIGDSFSSFSHHSLVSESRQLYTFSFYYCCINSQEGRVGSSIRAYTQHGPRNCLFALLDQKAFIFFTQTVANIRHCLTQPCTWARPERGNG